MLIVHNRFTFNCALNKRKPVTRTLRIRYILIFLIAPVNRSPYPVASNCLPRLLSQSFLATFKNAFPPRKWKLRFVCERICSISYKKGILITIKELKYQF